jgi:hypothetical protein
MAETISVGPGWTVCGRCGQPVPWRDMECTGVVEHLCVADGDRAFLCTRTWRSFVLRADGTRHPPEPANG